MRGGCSDRGGGAAGSASAATKWLRGPRVEHDPCRPGLATTVYRGGDARAGASTPRRGRDRGVNCFYVYPTVSNQQGRLATKRVDPETRSIALYQAARFAQLCRVHAPVYRQATVPALQAGTTTRRDYLTAYGDVEQAFDAFLRRIGRHRGFLPTSAGAGVHCFETDGHLDREDHRARGGPTSASRSPPQPPLITATSSLYSVYLLPRGALTI